MAMMILGPDGALPPEEVASLIGHNNPPVDPLDAFKAHFDDLRTEAGNWLDGTPVETQAQADDVARLMDAFRKSVKDADAARAAEKKPHDDAAKAVQAKWKPLLEMGELAIDACKKTIAPWLAKAEAEARARAEAARAEAERQAAEAAEAMRSAADNDIAAREAAQALQKDAEAAAKLAKRAEGQKASAATGGRAASLRTYYQPVLTDPKAALVHYVKTNPEAIKNFLVMLAAADVQRGLRTIPGFDVIEERRVA